MPTREEAKLWIIRNQLGRRNLQPFQRAELALKLAPIIEAKAKANQKEHGGTAPGKSLVQNSAQVIKTRNELAQISGLSHDTIAKAKVIEKEGTEEQKAKLRAGETSIHREYTAIRKEAAKPRGEAARKQRLAASKAHTQELLSQAREAQKMSAA